MLIVSGYSQVSNNQINEFAKKLKAAGEKDEDIEKKIAGIVKDPELYNTFWKLFIDQANVEDKKLKFFRDLNIQFKTFQTEENPNASLGFTYDFNFDYARFLKKDNKTRTSKSLNLSLKGNVAFKQIVNPADFLESKISYSFSRFTGGIVTNTDAAILSELNNINVKLAGMKDINSKEAIELRQQMGDNLNMTNQFFIALSPKMAFESNQKFSKSQIAPGLLLAFGAKAWGPNRKLSRYNFLDYPFSLIRKISGIDKGKKFKVYGSTIPVILAGIDYVIPTNDSIRNELLGNSNPFFRFKFETGFRTFVTRFNKENIFFNANYRLYKELGASSKIVNSNLDISSYTVLALQSTSGFYVSYANGKLPFDLKNDEIYSVGFNFKFN